jgi:hypothetical protein
MTRKTKQVRLGKVVKRRDENDENKFTLSIKQFGKLTGKQHRQLKAEIESTLTGFLEKLYATADESQQVQATV